MARLAGSKMAGRIHPTVIGTRASMDRKTLTEIPAATFGHVGAYPGMFLGLHIIATDHKGNLYTGDGRDGRVERFLFTGLKQ